jgi:hypothetical protein
MWNKLSRLSDKCPKKDKVGRAIEGIKNQVKLPIHRGLLLKLTDECP